MYQSRFRRLKEIHLPAFSKTRVLMLPLRLDDIETLPNDLSQYKRTVQELIEVAPVKKGVGYLTIDEKFVEKGQTLRLRGLHVDGLGEDGRQDFGIWAITGMKRYLANLWDDGAKKWNQGAAGIGGMVMVSNPAGCRAWNKDFEGKIASTGDCETLRSSFPNEEGTVLEAGVAYWCNAACVHESMPMEDSTERTFVRLSMPNDAPWYAGYTRNPKGVVPTGTVFRGFMSVHTREPEVILNG